MIVATWSPFREFEDVFGRVGRQPATGLQRRVNAEDGQRYFRPVSNVSENSQEYLIKAELPEVAKDAIEVSIDDGVITIKGERRHEQSAEDETLHRTESYYGSFVRSFTLPPDVDESGINAVSKDGVLTVRLPKAEVVAPKQIEVKLG